METIVETHLRFLRRILSPQTSDFTDAQEVMNKLRCLYKDQSTRPLFTVAAEQELKQMVSRYPCLRRDEMEKAGYHPEDNGGRIMSSIRQCDDSDEEDDLPLHRSSDESDEDDDSYSRRRGGYEGPSEADYHGRPHYPWDDHDVEFG